MKLNRYSWLGIVAAVVVVAAVGLIACGSNGKTPTPVAESVSDEWLEIENRDGLTIFYPNPDVTEIQLVCGTPPAVEDDSVVMVCAAAFTGELLEEFDHSNIAGCHVQGGHDYPGYECSRNTGAFAYSSTSGPRFVYGDYSATIDSAAAQGGMAFTQEMLIHEGAIVPRTRPDDDVNQYRALCDLNGRTAIIESHGSIPFGEFTEMLRGAGAAEALYLDMGNGWNWGFYRTGSDSGVKYPHSPTPHRYSTNWITFRLKSK